MKNYFLDHSIIFITRYRKCNSKEIKKIRYGLEGIYLTFTKLLIIFLVSIILGIFKEVLISLILFNIIRFTGFGFHAETSLQCLIISLLLFVLLPYLFININLSKNIVFIISILCIISYLLFAPADTVKRPLPNRKKRIIRKLLTCIIGIIYTFLIFIFYDLKIMPLLLTALVIEAIMINPLLYKLFHQPYNNYKNFIKA